MKSRKRDLEADREMCEEASPAPWDARMQYECMVPVQRQYVFAGNVMIARMTELSTRADGEFIAEARDALPYWLTEVGLLRLDVDYWKEQAMKAMNERDAALAQVKQQQERMDKLLAILAEVGDQS